MDGYNIGDTMFDPLEKKRKHKETVPEMEFLSKLGFFNWQNSRYFENFRKIFCP